MQPTKIILLFVISIFCVSNSYGIVKRVTTDADGGAGSLRDIVGTANPGDTILIDVTGTLVLNNPLQITTSVHILGPFPSRFKISTASLSTTTNGLVISANDVVIQGVGFEGGSALNYLVVGNYTGVRIQYCSFKLKGGSNGSAAQVEDGQVKIESCSFISNQSDLNGGAVAIKGTGHADLVNTTFYDNNASAQGAALYIDANATYKISHCTFSGNNGVETIYDAGVSSGNYTFPSSNSIYIDNTQGFAYSGTLITNFSTLGGNVIENGSFGFSSTGNDVWVSSNAQVNLSGMPVEDGFGLSHFIIGNATSQAIDIGAMSSEPSPLKDARMMPRKLFGDVSSEVDAGAVEFTPYYVDDLGGGSTNMHSLGWCIEEINTTSFPGPFVIEFRLPNPGGPHIIAQNASYFVNNDSVIINAYSQPGSLIPGPNVVGSSSLTKAEPHIVLTGNANSGILFNGNGCQLWGISTFDHGSHEVRTSGDGFIAFGNHFGVDQSGNPVVGAPDLVYLESDNNKIGGPAHWQRNILGSTGGGQGLVIDGQNNVVKNNYFGFDAFGTGYGADLVNGIHVLGSAIDTKIGGPQYLDGNRFGACNKGVYNVAANTVIAGNWFGIQYDGVTDLFTSGQNEAIHTTNSSNTQIGLPGYWGRNFVTTYSIGLLITSSSGVVIKNNFIGLDTTGNAELGVNMDKGVHFINSAGFLLGQLDGPNYIVKGVQEAVLVAATGAGDIFNNRIGIKLDGTLASGGIANGIDLSNSQGINIGGITPGYGNYIAQANNNLIYIHDGANTNQIRVQGNQLGLDETGNAHATTPHGILVENNSVPVLVGHETNASGANTIRYCDAGVLLGSGAGIAENVQVLQNSIYNDDGLGIDIYTGGTGVTPNDGVLMSSESNEGIDFPVILAANSCDGIGTTKIALEINLPPDNYIIEVYENTVPDASGYGEGENFLVSDNITTTNNPETVIIDAGAVLPVGTNLSATLTKVSGGTSEFSGNFSVQPSYTHTITITDPTCASTNDGEVNVQAIGATAFTLTPGTTQNVNDSYIFSNLDPNTYTLSIVYPNCQFDTTFTLTAPPDPTVNAGPDQTLCAGELPVNLNGGFGGSATGITWSGGNGTFGMATDPNTTYTPTATEIASGSVTLTINSTGSPCPQVSDDVTITIVPDPDPGTNNSIVLCDNAPVTSLLGELGGTPESGGSWNGPSTLWGGDSGDFNPATMTPGTYVYSVTNGVCTYDANVVVTVNMCSCSIDMINYTIGSCNNSDNTFDINGSVELTDPPTTGQLIIEDCNGNQTSVPAPFSSTESFTITSIDSDGASCNLTAYFTDNVGCTNTSATYNNPNPCQYNCVADAGTYTAELNNNSVSGNIDLCYGDTLHIVSNGDHVYPTDITPIDNSETYRPGLLLLAFSCSPPPASSGTGVMSSACYIGVYDASNGEWDIVNDLGDGSSVYLVPVTAYDTLSPTISHTPTAQYCYDLGQVYQVTFLEEITVTSTISQPIECYGDNDGEITINASNGNSPYTFSVDGTWGNPASNLGGGNHYIEVEDGNGCIAYDTVNIVEPSEVTVSATVSNDTCGNGVGEVILSANGGTPSYSYDFNMSGTSGNNTYPWLNAGTYTAQAEDANGCTSSVIQVVVGNYTGGDPSFTFSDFCPSAPAGPDNIVTSGGTFSFGTPPGNGTTINSGSGEITGAVSGVTYEVVYQVGPCSNNTDTVYVTAQPLDDPSFTYNDFCANDVGGPSNIATPGGTFSILPASASINPMTGIIINGVAGNTYDVIYETSNCPTTDTVPVQILEAPVQPQILTNQYIYCINDSIYPIWITNGNNNNAYSWNLNGSHVNGNATNPLEFTPVLLPGINNIYAEVDSTNGCSNQSDTLLLWLSDSTLINVMSPVYTCIGEEVMLSASGGETYEWTGDFATDNAMVNNPVIAPESNGMMEVIIEDEFGCLYKRNVEVVMENPENCDVTTYNAFSPNGDGNNDVWVIDGVVGRSNRVVIFNRWGQEIKSFENYNNQDVVWDGTNRSGGKLPTGTYYYIIEFEGQKMNGWVQLVK